MGEAKSGAVRGATLSAVLLACLGTGLAALGYAFAGVALNLDEIVGPGVFWCAVVFFLLAVPLRGAARLFLGAVRTRAGAAIFVGYMLVHLLLYGFLFDVVLASVYGVGYFSTGAGLLLSTNLFSPPSLLTVAFDVAYNPIMVVSLPPIFTGALSFYSISVALVIAVLVVANVAKTRDFGSRLTSSGRARTFVVLPAIGIVFGASCCLSVAGLVTLAAPAASLLASDPWIYYSTYFLFPCVAVAVLYLNLRSMSSSR